MRFLIDESLSQIVALRLNEAEHDAVHISDLGLRGATDDVVMAAALGDDRILVSVDTDFGTLLALTGAPGPSVVLLRCVDHRPAAQASLLVANAEVFEEPTGAGFIAVIDLDRIRVRSLPIAGSE